MDLSLQKKNPKGKVVHSGQRSMIVNIFKEKSMEFPELKHHELIEMVSVACGIGKGTVVKTLSHYQRTGEVASPPHKRSKPDTSEKLSEKAKYTIRKHIHAFWEKKELPTVAKILDKVNKDAELPSMSMSTLRRLLKTMKFKYIQRKRNSALIERTDLIRWRRNYMNKIREYRAEGRPIYYLDETWVNAGDMKQRVWLDTTVASSSDATDRGLTTGLPTPTGKGKRLIVVHIGSKDGFVPNGLLCFESKSKSGDYHDAMNGKRFFEWFNKIIDLLPEKAVIVMDNASYHSEKQEHCPIRSWTKPNIVQWLASKGVTVQSHFLKYQLLDEVDKIRARYDKYIIDERAKVCGKSILQLPPYHCELNPIELAWANVKGYVKANNTTFNFNDVKKLLIEGVERVTPQMCENFVTHTERVENKLYEIDMTMDDVVDGTQQSTASEDSQNETSEEEYYDVEYLDVLENHQWFKRLVRAASLVSAQAVSLALAPRSCAPLGPLCFSCGRSLERPYCSSVSLSPSRSHRTRAVRSDLFVSLVAARSSSHLEF